ncbi:hypothetical protein DYY67_0383 [Candidatus Nitrosotalea sp. TS]|uniref:hypothetical protein n=1 Tax=Candidatus Nitrosotalea sp. TS TaxID=2341020 RepID=UPI0014087DCE|nr:hypothetical protein [Candidatus Nitrosotalea sp. TS]NHI02686.1 hypothetical protein [Candidatus Nitrosotalea sp. TS]
MQIQDVFSLSFDALIDRKVRTVLTVMMVVLGSSLVVVLNGLSAGQAEFLEQQFNTLAANLLFAQLRSSTRIILARLVPRLS